MYTEGVADLEIMILYYPHMPPEEKEASLAKIKEQTRNRYFPAFEKVSGS
jgi:glutathione S-transferase